MQQSPHWLQWDAQNSPTKLPFPLRRSPPPSNTHIPRRHHPKRHPDPISRFATVGLHFPDRETHTQTDRWARRQVYTISAYARYIDRERRANNV